MSIKVALCNSAGELDSRTVANESGVKDAAIELLASCAYLSVGDHITITGDADPDEAACDHDWAFTGTAYGGDDERWHGEGRSYCTKCGADGDG